jgi:hypothetical protein
MMQSKWTRSFGVVINRMQLRLAAPQFGRITDVPYLALEEEERMNQISPERVRTIMGRRERQ